MKYTKILYPLAVVSLLIPGAGNVSAEVFSTKVSATIATQYLWRGFDLNRQDPVLQGDFIVNHKSGFSFGVWASNYDDGSDDGLEIVGTGSGDFER